MSAHPVQAAVVAPTVGKAAGTTTKSWIGAKAVGHPAHCCLESFAVAVKQALAHVRVARLREEGPMVGQQGAELQQFFEGRERKQASEPLLHCN